MVCTLYINGLFSSFVTPSAKQARLFCSPSRKSRKLTNVLRTHEDGGHVCPICGAKFKVYQKFKVSLTYASLIAD